MRKEEFERRTCDIKSKINVLQEELDKITEEYKTFLLQYNGYKIGDIVKDNVGKDCIVTGVDECYVSFYLQCRKIKKNGQPSKHEAAYLSHKLKEET